MRKLYFISTERVATERNGHVAVAVPMPCAQYSGLFGLEGLIATSSVQRGIVNGASVADSG